ncbi:MAG: RluA family pseudouridine synthase, partial [Treponema sp.]|nr:RluA family pseudouridine synthase [Treponema sp.]
ALHALLRKGLILVDGRAAAPGFRVKAGALITAPAYTAAEGGPPPPAAAPGGGLAGGSAFDQTDGFAINRIILWEDPALLALNKPAGLAVHPSHRSSYHPSGASRDNGDSLEGRVRSYLADKTAPSLSFRPGPLHRLDKPTSGIILFSKSLAGAQLYSRLFREGKLRKTYLALLEGKLEGPALWEEALVRDGTAGKTRALPEGTGEGGQKRALTGAAPLAYSPQRGLTLALIRTGTGRTHQIRAQASYHGHPLWGDVKYGGEKRGGFFLHALSLEFPPGPPADQGGLPPVLSAPLPAAYKKEIGALFAPKSVGIAENSGIPGFPQSALLKYGEQLKRIEGRPL